jgi:hypothetical protein
MTNIQHSYYYEFKWEIHASIKLIRMSTALWGKCDLNFFKLKSGASWELIGEMYPQFQDLIEHHIEHILKLLVSKHE